MAADLSDLRRARVTLRRPCPVCGRGSWCLSEPDGSRTLCMRVPSDRPARSGGWWHGARDRRDDRPRELAPIVPLRAAAPLAPPDRLDAVFRALCRHEDLALRNAHREALLARGLDAAAIARNGYASMRPGQRTRAARDVADRLDVNGIPGLYTNANRHGEYLALAGAPGMLVPVRDEAGRVRGLQIRTDDPGPDGPKYTWLSSARQEDHGGTGSGAPLHWTLAGDREGDLWLTEGALKGDTAAHLSGHRFLCFAGAHVGQADRLVHELRAVGWPADRRIILALDADRETNPNVRRGHEAIGRALSEAGYSVRVASWPLAVAKGIDDLLAAGGVPTVEADHWVPTVRRQASPAPAPGPRTDLVSLDQAQKALRRLVRDLFSSRAQRGVHVIEAPCGTGKTTAVVAVLGDLLASGRWPQKGRACLLTDTLDRAHELHADLVARAGDPERVALLVGRGPGNCADALRADLLGRHRHSPSGELCARCETGEAGSCAYLAQREAAEAASVVVACKAAVFHEADDLDGFQFVAVDEDLVPHLVSRVELDRDRLDAWVKGMDEAPETYPEDAPERVLVRALALAVGAIRYTRPVDENQRLHALCVPLRPHLQAVAQHLGLTWAAFRDLVNELDRAPAPKAGRMPFETPWARRTFGPRELRDNVPTRAFCDLVSMLARELDDTDRTDACLWLRAEQPARAGDLPDGAPLAASIVAIRPRETVLDLLAGRRVVLLDATPARWALDRLFPGAVTYHVCAVREPLRVVQTTGSVHANPKHLPAIRAWVEAQAGGPPARLTRKRLAVAEGLDGDDLVGWFGRDDRAHNEWTDAPALLVEGHYGPPVDEARMLVQALRYGRPPEGQPARYVPYEGTDREGLRAGALAELDADLAAYTSEFWGATVRQAIGRLRACRRRQPALVVILSRIPAPGVRVSELTTMGDLLGFSNARGRQDRLDEANARRRDEAQQRITEAVRRFYTAREALPSARALVHLAGCSLTRATGALQALRAMGPNELRQHLGVSTTALPAEDHKNMVYSTSAGNTRVETARPPAPPPPEPAWPTPSEAPKPAPVASWPPTSPPVYPYTAAREPAQWPEPPGGGKLLWPPPRDDTRELLWPPGTTVYPVRVVAASA